MIAYPHRLVLVPWSLALTDSGGGGWLFPIWLFIAFYCRVPLLCYTPNVHHLVFYWVVGFLVGLYYATFFGTAFSITLVLSPQKKVASRSVRSVCKGLKALCEASVRFWEKQWQKVPTFPTEDSGTSKIWANYFYFPKLLNLNGSEPPTTISVDPGSFTKPPRPGHGTQHSQRGSGRSTSWKHQHPRGVEECCSQTLTTNQGWWGNRGPEFSPQNHMFSQSERIGPTEFGTNSKSNLLPASLGVIYGEPRNWCRFKSSCTVSLFANSIALVETTVRVAVRGDLERWIRFFFHKLTRPEQLIVWVFRGWAFYFYT